MAPRVRILSEGFTKPIAVGEITFSEDGESVEGNGVGGNILTVADLSSLPAFREWMERNLPGKYEAVYLDWPEAEVPAAAPVVKSSHQGKRKAEAVTDEPVADEPAAE